MSERLNQAVILDSTAKTEHWSEFREYFFAVKEALVPTLASNGWFVRKVPCD